MVKDIRFAVAFDLNIEVLAKNYGAPYNGAYGEIKKFLAARGFDRQQGSLYYGNDSVDAVKAVLAVSAMSRAFPWFAPSVSDIRLLRIEDDDDLSPALVV